MFINKVLLSLVLVTFSTAAITSCVTKGATQFGVSGGSARDNLALITPLEQIGTLIRLSLI